MSGDELPARSWVDSTLFSMSDGESELRPEPKPEEVTANEFRQQAKL